MRKHLFSLYRRLGEGYLLIALLAMASAMPGDLHAQQPRPLDPDHVQQSVNELTRYLDLAQPVERTAFEVILLPAGSTTESAQHIVLVASVTMITRDRLAMLEGLPRLRETPLLLPAFSSAWMSTMQRSMFGPYADAFQGVYDARSLLRRPAKRAFAIPTQTDVLFYVEYRSP